MSKGIDVQIQTISNCNAKCVFCPYPYSWFKENPGKMTDELFEKIISNLEKIHVDRIFLYLMNEPLLDKKIFDRIEIVKKRLKYRWIGISTNASLLTEENTDKLIKAFKDTPHDLWVSFHGTNKENFEYNTGLNFEKCLFNVLGLIAQGNDLKIRIHGVGNTFEGNVSKNFSNDEYQGFWKEMITELEERHQRAFNNYKIHCFEYCNRGGNVKGMNNHIKPLKDLACVRMYNWIHIIYTGEVILCCNDYNKEIVIGNVNNQSIEEILNCTDLKKYRQVLKGNVLPNDNFLCKRCDFEGVGNRDPGNAPDGYPIELMKKYMEKFK